MKWFSRTRNKNVPRAWRRKSTNPKVSSTSTFLSKICRLHQNSGAQNLNKYRAKLKLKLPRWKGMSDLFGSFWSPRRQIASRLSPVGKTYWKWEARFGEGLAAQLVLILAAGGRVNDPECIFHRSYVQSEKREKCQGHATLLRSILRECLCLPLQLHMKARKRKNLKNFTWQKIYAALLESM